MTELLAGLALGLSSSVHCALMCGPLTLALHRGASSRGDAGSSPVTMARRPRLTTRLAAHHAGRLGVYVTAGLIAGGVGHVASSAGLGRVLAVSTGVALVATACRRRQTPSGARFASAIGRRLGGLTSIATRVTGRWPHGHCVALGVLNGLLPCGMVYTALTASLALGSAGGAGLFMLGFGAGTLPALVAALATVPRLSWRLFPRLTLVARVVTVVVGLSLIAQGAGLSFGQRGAPSGGHHHLSH